MNIPHDPDAERRVLGAVLADAAAHWPHCEALAEEHFHDERHKAIFRALRSAAQKSEPLEVLTAQRGLNSAWRAYVSELPDKVPPDPQVAHFIRRLEECRFLRGMQLALRHTDAAQVLQATRRAVSDFENQGLDPLAWGPSRPSGKLPAIQDAAAPITTPRPAELVQGILHQGSKLVVGGGSKSFKTFLLLDLAVSVAYGKRWLGHATGSSRRKEAAISNQLSVISYQPATDDRLLTTDYAELPRVLYVNLEIQPVFFAERLAAVAAAKGIALEPGRIDIWNLRGYAAEAGLILPEIEKRVKAVISNPLSTDNRSLITDHVRPYSLIVLDPIYKLYGALDENKAGDMARLLNQLEHLAVTTGAAVAFGAHFSKGNQAGKESIDRISGSGVFARDPDALLIFTRHKEQEAFTVEATLRNFAPIEPFVVRWQYPLMKRDEGLDPGDLKRTGGSRERQPEEVLCLLGDRSLSATEWQRLANEQAGIGRSTFFRLKAELVQSGRVAQSKVTDKWEAVSPTSPSRPKSAIRTQITSVSVSQSKSESLYKDSDLDWKTEETEETMGGPQRRSDLPES